ncbi:MAG: flavin-dependent oxidoreductase [Minwuia sp.]|uniref:flavin-dependent oxidoreductase n=1 Tax=Minwuia sp. TaxID=2493630 RepID=UPI003A881519
MTVIIAGGGIGGLTAALSLHRAGIACRVYEAVPEIRALGVGINLLPHAVRELTELGLQDELAATAIPTAELIYANRHGQQIWREARGKDAGYRWPQFSISRGALQMILRDAVAERLGKDAILTDHELTGFDQDGGGVTAHFRSRTTGETRGPVRGSVLIGADGIHSTVRRHFYPDEGAPIWNGCVLWRATTTGEPYLTGRSMVMAGHANQKFVCYPISKYLHDAGRALINWIAEIRFPTDPPWRREDWNRPGRIEDFLPAFESWDFGWLKVPDIIRGANEIYEYPMVDRDPVGRWSFDRVTLMGDAAHAMYPIGSNGASQAILDARVLAMHLARDADPVAALAAYDAERRPPTSAIVLANRGNGPEQGMQMVEERAPDGFRDIHDVMDPAELADIAARYKTTAGFDVDTLNGRPSFDP